MSGLKLLTGVACEYVAQGHLNKHTLVNIYSGDILVKEFPATFPVAFYIVARPLAESGTPFNFQVKLGTKTIARAESELPVLDEGSDSFVLALPALPVTVEAPSQLKVVVSVPGHRKATLVTVGIRQGVRG